MSISNICLYIVAFLFTLYLSLYLSRKLENHRIISILDQDIQGQTDSAAKHIKKATILPIEESILKRFGMKPEQYLSLIWAVRAIVIVLVVALLLRFRGLVLMFASEFFISLYFNQLYKKELYDSGVVDIPFIDDFIYYFVPNIKAGGSADQIFSNYVQESEDQELLDYYNNRNNPDYKISPHIGKIVEIYKIALHNEIQGNNDYTSILNDIAKDYNTKSNYYNRFLSGIGEVKSTVWSYYLGIPFLIILSLNYTKNFWYGAWGWALALVMIIVYAAFELLIYRVKKNTLKKIF